MEVIGWWLAAVVSWYGGVCMIGPALEDWRTGVDWTLDTGHWSKLLSMNRDHKSYINTHM